eukprot:s6536_g2.t1
MAKASQAVNDAEAANEDAAVPRGQVSEMVGLAATLVEHLAGGGDSTGASSSGGQAGAGTGGSRKGKSKPMEDPVTEEDATDEAEESEESPQGLDPIVEGRDDDAEDGPTTLTEVPQSSMTELQEEEESEEASSSAEPRRILRSPYSRAYGQAVWSGQIGWGDDLPPHLHPRPEEYGNATWPETPEDDAAAEAAGSSSDAAPGTAEVEHAARVRANLELDVAPTGATTGPLPTVDEEVPADEDANVGDQVTAGNDAHEGNDVSEVNDAPAEAEVVANDEGGTAAGSLEEEEKPLPPRVNREEGEHGMGPPPPPTRWDQRPSMVQ